MTTALYLFLLQQQERATNFFSNVYREDGARYGYIANLCVAKCARRQGIASNMLCLAIEAAKSDGTPNWLCNRLWGSLPNL